MGIRIVRLGTPRHSEEGLRIGAVRRLPRGVPKSEYGKRDYFDVWLPERFFWRFSSCRAPNPRR